MPESRYALCALDTEHFDIYWMTDVIRLFRHAMTDLGLDVVLNSKGPARAEKKILFLHELDIDAKDIALWEADRPIIVSVWPSPSVARFSEALKSEAKRSFSSVRK